MHPKERKINKERDRKKEKQRKKIAFFLAYCLSFFKVGKNSLAVSF